MTFSPSWYTQHPQAVEESDPTTFDEMPLNKFAAVVANAGKTNADLHNAAISRADAYSWQVAHPEYIRNNKNHRLMNHWLKSKGLFDHSTYPDFQAAYEALTADGLLDIDEAELARDNRGNRSYKGAISGKTYDSIDTMILQERQAALQKVPEPTKEEIAFENLPIEQVQTLLRQAEHGAQIEENGLKTQKNGDAWITLNPWYVDNKHNGRLMKMQLATNGITDNNASVQDFDIAAKQLRDAGLLTLNKSAVTKEHVAEVADLASEAVKSFDKTPEEIEDLNLPLDEIRRRAFGIF